MYGVVRDAVCLADLDAARFTTHPLGLDIRNQHRVLQLSRHRFAALPLVVRSKISKSHGGIATATDLEFRSHPARSVYFARP